MALTSKGSSTMLEVIAYAIITIVVVIAVAALYSLITTNSLNFISGLGGKLSSLFK